MIVALAILLLMRAGAASGEARTDIQQITAALREERFEPALQLTEHALAETPRDPRLWTLQGLAHAGLHNEKDALADYKHATEIDPKYMPAWQAEAQIEFRNHNVRCEDTLHHILTLQPGNEVAHAMLGALAFGRQYCTTVVREYAASGTVIDTQASALAEYGQCRRNKARRRRLYQLSKRLPRRTLETGGCEFNLAVAQLMNGQAADALHALEPMLAEAAPSPQTLDLAASAYEQMGDTPHAVESLRRAIAAAPADSSLYLHFADLSLVTTSFPVGITMLNAGLKRAPDAAPLYMARGILLVQSGQYAEAQADFDRAGALDPKQSSSAAASGLAKLQQSNLDEALRITRSKLKQNGGDAYLNYLLAETLRQKGADAGSPEFAEALTAVQRALQLEPSFASPGSAWHALPPPGSIPTGRRAVQKSARNRAAQPVGPVSPDSCVAEDRECRGRAGTSEAAGRDKSSAAAPGRSDESLCLCPAALESVNLPLFDTSGSIRLRLQAEAQRRSDDRLKLNLVVAVERHSVAVHDCTGFHSFPSR